MRLVCRRFVTLVTAVALLIPAAVLAQVLEIEAEEFTAHNDLAGMAIQSWPGSGCSGGFILIGLDFTGEWTEYDVSVSAFGYYSLSLKCIGELNQPYSLRMVFTPVGEGTEQVVDFSFIGKGYG
ncbi:MAG: hypothetical protein JSW58_00875 [Candidatus Latescibacterota bacterium]|nr:MAG: hypothetical protein JSW58_00875 [Candidatus Latescibacterota bacterium]